MCLRIVAATHALPLDSHAHYEPVLPHCNLNLRIRSRRHKLLRGSEMARERSRCNAGTSYVRFAAFTDDADLADVAYFRLARAEAVALDPQTRILLQVMTHARLYIGFRV